LYKLHLIKKYLLKRRIAWVALIAITLCTAMVLVVISVMGGWLEMFRSSFRGMSGDVIVDATSQVDGFAHYQEMLDGIRKLPDVQAATPTILSAGLINIGGQRRDMVQILGVYLDQYDQVGDFSKTLDRQYTQRKNDLVAASTQPSVTDAQRNQMLDDAEHPHPTFDLLPDISYEIDAGPKAKGDVRKRPGMIISDVLVGVRKKETAPGIMYELPTTLTMVAVTPGQQISADDAVPAAFWIVDDSHSRIWQLDYNTVYVPFDELQKDLKMTAFGDQPARTSNIEIKAKPGVDLMNLRGQVETIVDRVNYAHGMGIYSPTRVSTWEQVQGKFLDAVEHEVVLTTALFGIISIVAVFLIFCIFYMIVIEKTRDIGVIKSVGATAGGILQLFLGYGLAIGVVGAGAGFTIAYFFVRYINELHAWLGRAMGIVIWDPETYEFDKIPNHMNPRTAACIVAVAILSALLGALFPAIRAANMNPVEALRYE
jgi:lipoprotein-releasing system permease protein